MKNYIIILIIITSSCEQIGKPYKSAHYLHITNNTKFPVELSFYTSLDTALLRSYSVEPYDSKYFDTTVYRVENFGAGPEYELIEGIHGSSYSSVNAPAPIWNYDTYTQYKFGDFKQSILEKITIEKCGDTTSLDKPCNFYTFKRLKADRENRIDKFDYSYYITNQQYLLADSI